MVEIPLLQKYSKTFDVKFPHSGLGKGKTIKIFQKIRIYKISTNFKPSYFVANLQIFQNSDETL